MIRIATYALAFQAVYEYKQRLSTKPTGTKDTEPFFFKVQRPRAAR